MAARMSTAGSHAPKTWSDHCEATIGRPTVVLADERRWSSELIRNGRVRWVRTSPAVADRLQGQSATRRNLVAASHACTAAREDVRPVQRTLVLPDPAGCSMPTTMGLTQLLISRAGPWRARGRHARETTASWPGPP